MPLTLLALADCAYKVEHGRYCPCCGGFRALEALLHFDIARSLYCNPIVVLLLGMGVLWVLPLVSKHFKASRYHLVKAGYGIATLVIWLGFAFVRNHLLSQGVDMLGDIL